MHRYIWDFIDDATMELCGQQRAMSNDEADAIGFNREITSKMARVRKFGNFRNRVRRRVFAFALQVPQVPDTSD